MSLLVPDSKILRASLPQIIATFTSTTDHITALIPSSKSLSLRFEAM